MPYPHRASKLLQRSLWTTWFRGIALVSFFWSLACPNLGVKAYTLHRIVLDAGHGGHDSGCKGKGSLEKVVTLEIARKVADQLRKRIPGLQVHLTRNEDKFIELHERAGIANRLNADLFVSIHCNSGGAKAHGTETFTQGLHVTGANLNVAKRENSAVLMESNYLERYDGFNPNDPTAHIIFELFQSAYRTQSLELARLIEQKFVHHTGRHSRGVKQAGFLVLYRTTMPAVLVETGFLTHQEEEQFMRSEQGQNKLSLSIAEAIEQYHHQNNP
ncbi:MAG: N-acetylmuramoyl-L-alanine amidase [Sphingobacteriia bacterium]|nr:N-acetylmuramoyl-L-alanine amidase [Sphingobacteriia bacterium]